MTWQDAIFGLGNALFALSLVPMFLRRVDPPVLTTLGTGLILVAFIPAWVSLGLWVSLAFGSLTAAMWLGLAARSAWGGYQLP